MATIYIECPDWLSPCYNQRAMSAINPLPDCESRAPVRGDKGYEYTDSERTKALAIYAETNNINATARATGISVRTIWAWLQDDEALDLVASLRNHLRAECIVTAVDNAKKALALVAERLEHGDPMVVGKRVEYHPVKAKDAAIIASVMIDKATLLTGQIEASRSNAALDKLASALLEQAKELSKRRKDGPPALDVTELIG